MGRLIESDKLKADLEKAILENGDMDCLDFLRIASLIDAQPTAYDVDAVVKQLEELTEEECTLHECGIRSERCKPCIAKKAIEIVKAGGLNAKTDS